MSFTLVSHGKEQTYHTEALFSRRLEAVYGYVCG